MTPSDKTIAAVLALPLEARRLLAERAQGPGWWLCFDAGHYYCHAGSAPGDRDVHPLSAWLPCAPTEILRVWAEHAGGPCWQVDDSEALLSWDPYNLLAKSMCEPHDGTLDGMLRAAVQCWPGDD